MKKITKLSLVPILASVGRHGNCASAGCEASSSSCYSLCLPARQSRGSVLSGTGGTCETFTSSAR